jgi:hypothetical protein
MTKRVRILHPDSSNSSCVSTNIYRLAVWPRVFPAATTIDPTVAARPMPRQSISIRHVNRQSTGTNNRGHANRQLVLGLLLLAAAFDVFQEIPGQVSLSTNIAAPTPAMGRTSRTEQNRTRHIRDKLLLVLRRRGNRRTLLGLLVGAAAAGGEPDAGADRAHGGHGELLISRGSTAEDAATYDVGADFAAEDLVVDNHRGELGRESAEQQNGSAERRAQVGWSRGSGDRRLPIGRSYCSNSCCRSSIDNLIICQ